MQIAVVANTAWTLFNFRLNLMQALTAAGHTVVAVAPADEYADRIRAAGFAFEAVPISGRGTNPALESLSVLRLWQTFRRCRVDLVLSYTPKGNLYSALACIASGVPFVPNVSGLGWAFAHKSLATHAAKTLYRLTFRRARRVFFQNANDMDVFVRTGLVRAERSERLPGSGVDLSRFAPEMPTKSAPGEPVFLLAGRLLWDKGVGEYVDAARLVRARYPAARFQLLGFLGVDNPSAITQPQVDKWVAEGVVEYLGPTDDVPRFLANADCVVSPSKYREGVPRILLEAAAVARPIITTDAPGCRDAVIDGETGFLCRAGDAQDLAEKLMQFIRLSPEERLAMGQRGRRYVEQHFDEQLVIDRYLQLVAGFRTPEDVAG